MSSTLTQRHSAIEFSCPKGGEWYACETGSMFVGCCTNDPCSNGCAQGDIRAGSFPEEDHGEFPDASCGSNSDFFTCTGPTPPFWGCCKSNPCADGCPAGDLVPAFIDRPDQKTAYLPSDSHGSEPSGSASPSPSGESGSGGKSNTAAIAGGAAGGGVALLLLIGLAIFFIRRRRSRAGQSDNEQRYTAFPPSAQQPEKPDQGVFGQQPDAPPHYTSPAPAYASKFPGGENHPYDQQYKNAHMQQFEAVELPSSPSQTTSQQRHLSELPSESALAPMELESPGPSSPAHSPRIPASPEMNNNWGQPQSPNRNSLGVPGQQPNEKGGSSY